MGNILLTSTIPYWIAFIAMTACFAVCYIYRIQYPGDNNTDDARQLSRPISRRLMLTVSGTCLLIALFEIAVYMTVGTKCLWWCTGDDLGFFGKLLREIPLIVFLVLQVLQAFFYKLFMDNYLQRNLSIMPTAIGFLCVLPVCIVLYIILSIVDVTKESRDMIFYIALGTLMVGAIGYALIKNVKECGTRDGVISVSYTHLTLPTIA